MMSHSAVIRFPVGAFAFLSLPRFQSLWSPLSLLPTEYYRLQHLLNITIPAFALMHRGKPLISAVGMVAVTFKIKI
jgi:hypothetical protein